MNNTASGDRPPPDDRTRTIEPVRPDAETVLQATVDEAQAAFVPFTLGRYRVTERLGAGGFGTVYRDYDEDLAREVAVVGSA